MKYYASFTANNGSTYSVGAYEFTNKKKAVKAMREIVEANHFQQYGNCSGYTVWNKDNIIVMSATCLDHNLRWSVDNELIGVHF